MGLYWGLVDTCTKKAVGFSFLFFFFWEKGGTFGGLQYFKD